MDERDYKAMNDELKNEFKECCGNCKNFLFESIHGNGLCSEINKNKHCSEFCIKYERYIYGEIEHKKLNKSK